MGSGLSAEVTLYAAPELKTLLAELGDELRFVLITSAVTLLDESSEGQATDVVGLRVKVAASTHTKCTRCWHYRADVGHHASILIFAYVVSITSLDRVKCVILLN